MTARKKLIEVALPLDAINEASAYDKMPGIGPHPKGIHNWWARLPLPCARAVLFASLVDDPSADPSFASEPEDVQDRERERLFAIVRSMLEKNARDQPEIFRQAYREIERSCGGAIPAVLDPFCGGGSIPLEAQRLGLMANASDLNSVAVLITKAMIEILPRFRGVLPVNPDDRERLLETRHDGGEGLAADIRYYGAWMKQQAEERVGALYPRVAVPGDYGGGTARVIAWLWARTVECPNPSCRARMPLISSLWLSRKKGKRIWLEPIVDRSAKTVRFEIASGAGAPSDPPKMGRGAKFRCLVCREPAPERHIKDEGLAKRMTPQLTTIVGQGQRGRLYLPATAEHAEVAAAAVPAWAPDEELPFDPRNIWCTMYGLTAYRDLFTSRQLVALTTFSDLLADVHAQVLRDSVSVGLVDDWAKATGAKSARSYADAVVTFLAFAVDRCADFNNALCRWKPSGEQLMQLFGRQAIPMVWDFAEANILGDEAVCWFTAYNIVADAIASSTTDAKFIGHVEQLDAATAAIEGNGVLVSTDPPYYDNISYSDLSDFFYVWLRRSVGKLYSGPFSTVLVPKAQELVATPYHFDGHKMLADRHFEEGFRNAFALLKDKLDPRFPLTVYYAFKQSDHEDDADDGGSVGTPLTTGWETMLEGLLSSGFQITATWPVRASQAWRMTSMGTNALASYIVLACRPREVTAPLTTRRDFVAALKRELPDALRKLQRGNIAPVDLAQASIGPGMAVFSRYSKVLEADGAAMRVRPALSLINQALDEVLAEQENEYDPETRWAVAWFDQFAMAEGPYGSAETLSKAKNTAVERLVESALVRAKAGRVRLLGRDELNGEWDPGADDRITVWETTQHLIHALETNGEAGAAALLGRVGSLGEVARDLSYRLFATCERRGWAKEAVSYNSLVVVWPEIARLASRPDSGSSQQTDYLASSRASGTE